MRCLPSVAAFLLLFAVSAGAYEYGTYVGAGYGIANYRDDGRMRTIDNRDNGVYRLNAGAYLSESFSVEASYHTFVDFDAVSALGVAASEKFTVLGIAALGHYDPGSEVDLFARMGAGQIFWRESGAEVKESDAAVLIGGAGIGYRPLTWLRLSAGYDFFHFGMDLDATRYDMLLAAPYLQLEVLF